MGLRDRLAKLLHVGGGLMAVQVAKAWRPAKALTVLTYHHVCEPGPGYQFDPDCADVTPAQFRRQMQLVKRNFSVIGLAELARGLDSGRLPPNPIAITFDDGYRSNLIEALPVLRELELPATFFIATGFATQRRLYWWDRIAYLVAEATVPSMRLTYPTPATIALTDRAAARAALVKVVKDHRELELERFLVEVAAAAGVAWDADRERALADELIMTWDEIRALAAAGMAIESHSQQHRVLETMAPAALAADLRGARAELERELGKPSVAIAYPVGRAIAGYPAVRTAVADAGYQLGFTNASGVIDLTQPAKLDRLGLNRVAVDRDLSDALFLAQLVIPRMAYSRPSSIT